ncbi:MAG: T9SS type A sorting domain-containing protein, partial [Vicingaceae bacterium]
IHPFSDADFQFTVPQDFSTVGDYNITCVVTDIDDGYGNNDTLNLVLSKIYLLDGELSIGQLTVICDNQVSVNAIVTNRGENTITDVEIEVIVNGIAVDTIQATVDIAYQDQENVEIIVDDNLVLINNNIALNLLSVNTQVDGNATNNLASTTTTLDSDYELITLIINADNYPEETSWKVYDEGANQIVATGSLPVGTTMFSEDICLDYSSCFSLFVYDSYGDGICCAYGNGFFLVLNSSGDTIVTNGGEFHSEAQETFCPDGTGCELTADINVTNTSSLSADDGVITINISSGMSPFQYSIDGGQTYVDTNAFINLVPGNYNIMIQGAIGICSYQGTVTIESCEFTTADIESLDATSVVTTDGQIVITPTSGVGPYLYSIDGGQNFDTNNVFLNLPVGPYNIIVQDASGICLYEEGVPIEVIPVGIRSENDVLTNGIKIYPNPTNNNFNIEIESLSTLSNNVNIVVYDNLGRTIQTGSISKESGWKITISLEDYFPGTYFIKCYNNYFEKHFKVVKI